MPIGLIGDDIEAVSKNKSKEYDGKTIVPVRCGGFRGVSQSLGHHIANDTIRDWVFDKIAPDAPPKFEQTPYDVAIIGDYNIGGDAWSSRILLEEMRSARHRAMVGRRHAGRARGDAQGAGKKAAPDSQLWLEPGKPMLFAGGSKGLRLNHETWALDVVALDGQTPEAAGILVHDETNDVIAKLLIDMPVGSFPVALGDIYCNAAPAFDGAVADRSAK